MHFIPTSSCNTGRLEACSVRLEAICSWLLSPDACACSWYYHLHLGSFTTFPQRHLKQEHKTRTGNPQTLVTGDKAKIVRVSNTVPRFPGRLLSIPADPSTPTSQTLHILHNPLSNTLHVLPYLTPPPPHYPSFHSCTAHPPNQPSKPSSSNELSSLQFPFIYQRNPSPLIHSTSPRPALPSHTLRFNVPSAQAPSPNLLPPHCTQEAQEARFDAQRSRFQ
ncbi:hypothetical protein E2C01_026169 [Portunus trituberculatus]|uniref:Uncharacterized protein n=1 Tax=Portunus trituberculatus TaxID=210409 RepID=A0A5B7EHE1_PORTR|nr:hypothetical protein [Portunus trituberculatus]